MTDKIVNLGPSQSLGVISGDAGSKPKDQFSTPIRENAQILAAYAALLGKQAVQTDLVEIIAKEDREANTEARDAKPSALAAALNGAGFSAKLIMTKAVVADLWPAVALMEGGQFVLVQAQSDAHVTVYDIDNPAEPIEVDLKEFARLFTGRMIKAKPTVEQLRETHDTKAKGGHWFWSELLRYKRLLGDVALGSLVANMLAVAVALFSLQVYDRVIPHQSSATLWVLAIGALLAIGFEAILKISRARLMDGAGRALEIRVQDILIGRLLGMRADKRPLPPSATFAAMREFSSVREFFTAASVGAIADLPFVLLFLALVAYIGGPIVWVLAIGGALMVLPGFFLQRKMMALTKEAQGSNAKASRALQEVVFELETVKTQRGEDRFRRHWNELTGLGSVTASEQRKLGSALQFWSQGVQQATYVSAVIVGTFLVFAGEFTVGSIIAIGILTGRTLSPLTQLAGTLSRWSNVKTALDGLDTLIDAEQDHAPGRSYLRREKINGAFELRDLGFTYDEDTPPVLDIPKMVMEPGEKCAVLGTNGSGKSTLLKIMAGLYAPTKGRIALDAVDMGQLDTRDIRRAVGYLGQDVRLFSGTLRENLSLNQIEHDDERMLHALDFAGLGQYVRNHPKGLDMEIRDAGEGLSMGQRQSLGWARLWLQDPRVVLLDEPTAALDQTLENALISRLETWLEGRTALIATHRVPILSLTSRTFILQNGRLAVDGPRDKVISHLMKGKTTERSA